MCRSMEKARLEVSSARCWNVFKKCVTKWSTGIKRTDNHAVKTKNKHNVFLSFSFSVTEWKTNKIPEDLKGNSFKFNESWFYVQNSIIRGLIFSTRGYWFRYLIRLLETLKRKQNLFTHPKQDKTEVPTIRKYTLATA